MYESLVFMRLNIPLRKLHFCRRHGRYHGQCRADRLCVRRYEGGPVGPGGGEEEGGKEGPLM